eukprot:1612930-Prymnesium_polylepis.1
MRAEGRQVVVGRQAVVGSNPAAMTQRERVEAELGRLSLAGAGLSLPPRGTRRRGPVGCADANAAAACAAR